MQGLAQNGYSADEVRAALQGRTGSRKVTFRYDLLNSVNNYKAALSNVLGGSISLNNLADIKRTAKFRVTDDGSINFLSDRIKPWVRVGMPRSSLDYTGVLAQIPNQLLRWKLDEVTGSIANDSSGAPILQGTIPATGVTKGQAGLLDSGSSMLFATGNTGITTPGTWLNGLDSVTVVAWVRNDGALSANRDITSGAVNLSYAHQRSPSTVVSTVRLDITTDHGTVIAECVAGTQSTAVQCIVATWTAGLGVRLYINGEPQVLSTTTLPLAAAIINGSTTFGVGPGWIGAIDDVSVFRSPVSADQARRIYQAGLRRGPYGPDNYAEWPQGVFLLSSPNRKRTVAGTITRDVDAYDQLQVLVDDRVSDRYTVTAGTLYTEAVRTLLSGIPTKSIANSTLTLPVAKDWEPGTSKLTIINELLSAINYRSLSFDESGVGLVQPYTSPQDRPPEYNYVDDGTSVIAPDAEQTLDVFSIPNKWVLVVSDPDRAPLVGTYTNADPTSLTSTVSRGRTIVDFRTEQDAADQASLDAKAKRLAFEASQVYEEVPFNTAIMPFHSGDDVYSLTYSGLAIAAKYSEHTWDMTLEAGTLMKHTARRVVQV
jgi:Concanavalin A-like lectin/glucanases superfamily